VQIFTYSTRPPDYSPASSTLRLSRASGQFPEQAALPLARGMKGGVFDELGARSFGCSLNEHIGTTKLVERATGPDAGSFSQARHSHKVGTLSCASFHQNVVYVEFNGSNAQSQLLSDFLI
jgi:hypothetical protein